MAQQTLSEIRPAWTLQENCCGVCGGSLDEGYQERDYGVDAETGYRDVWLVCVHCAEKGDE
jgi:hypothetical protein